MGISTNPESREVVWRERCPTLHHWQVLGGPFQTKVEAQDLEAQLRRHLGCLGEPDTDDAEVPNAVWWVYRFQY